MSNIVGIFYGFKFVGEDLVEETLTNFLGVLGERRLGRVSDEETFMVSPDLVDVVWSSEFFPEVSGGLDVSRVRLSVLRGTPEVCLIVFVEPLHFVNFGGSFDPVGLPGVGSDGWGVMEFLGAVFGWGVPEWFVYGETV